MLLWCVFLSVDESTPNRFLSLEYRDMMNCEARSAIIIVGAAVLPGKIISCYLNFNDFVLD